MFEDLADLAAAADRVLTSVGLCHSLIVYLDPVSQASGIIDV